MKLDPAERVATLSTKETVGFDKALIATGANVRRLRVDGAELDGIHYLRAFGQLRRHRARTPQAPSAWCWSEAATSAARWPRRSPLRTGWSARS